MAGVTLAEAKRSVQLSEPRLAGLYQSFLNNAPVLKYLPFENVLGSTITWTKEKTLPTTAFRAVDAAYTAASAVTETESVTLKILGGKFNADRAVVKMMTESALQTQWRMQEKSLARVWENNFFNGVDAAGAFTGLFTRVAAAETTYAGTNGAALNLGMLDEIITDCEGDNKVLWMNESIYLSIQKLARTKSNVNFMPNNFGEYVLTFNNIPIEMAGKKADNTQILLFDETRGTSDVTSSVYCTAFGDDGVQGLQNRPMERILNDENTPAGAYEVEWINNYGVMTTKSATAVKGILDSAVIDS